MFSREVLHQNLLYVGIPSGIGVLDTDNLHIMCLTDFILLAVPLLDHIVLKMFLSVQLYRQYRDFLPSTFLIYHKVEAPLVEQIRVGDVLPKHLRDCNLFMNDIPVLGQPYIFQCMGEVFQKRILRLGGKWLYSQGSRADMLLRYRGLPLRLDVLHKLIQIIGFLPLMQSFQLLTVGKQD